jgi:hypothetical protein
LCFEEGNGHWQVGDNAWQQAVNMNSSYNSGLSYNIKASGYNLGTLLSI